MPEKKLFKTVKDFEDRIKSYFSQCEETGAYPDEAGLILWLGLEREQYERYMSGAEGKGYAACLKRARLRRESIIIREIYGSDKASTGKIFLARQLGNGGLTDKPKEENASLTIDVKLSGAGSEPFD